MDISITDQDGNTLEITLGSDVSLVDFVSGSDSTLAWSELVNVFMLSMMQSIDVILDRQIDLRN